MTRLGVFVCTILLGLLEPSWAFLPPKTVTVVTSSRAAPPTRRYQMQITGDVLPRSDEGTERQQGGPNRLQGRPGWFKELLIAKESRVVQGEHELRRLDWEVEDDEAVDELVVSGQMEEARKYFDEKKATSVPVYRETLRYYWTQTETEVVVNVPVPKALRGVNLHLIVAEDCLQMALVEDPAFGVLSGKFPGTIDPATSGWQLAENPDGSYAVSMTLRKLSQPGTHSMWFSMFVNEVPGSCMKYRGHSSEGTQGQQYHWSQTVDFMNAFFPIPDDVRGKQVELTFDKEGGSMQLSYPFDGPGRVNGRMVMDKQLSGLVNPGDCSWVVDEDEKSQRCVCVSLMKRSRTAAGSTWWSRLFKEEEADSLPRVKALDEARARVEKELAMLQAAMDVEDVQE